ncbi:hypothetical protein BC829DRAFT_445764 [Chytridium lagenaria]|nr:hypothetical protein BC829DRAFT_445764 [Chytridium lagenaria]
MISPSTPRVKNLLFLLLLLPSLTTSTATGPPIDPDPTSRVDDTYDYATSPHRFDDDQTTSTNLPTLDALLPVLPRTPRGYGIPCSNRTHWVALHRSRRFWNDTQLETSLRQSIPFPPWSNAAYLAYSRTGDPLPGRTMIPERMRALGVLALAECRGVAAVLETPENDPRLFLFHGRGQHFNLYAGPTVGILAQIVWLLGDRVRANVAAVVRSEVERRVLTPSRTYFQTGNLGNWTFENIFISESNRNPLTFGGVLLGALMFGRDLRERAVVVRGIAQFVQRLGYYGLGFGSYLEVRELMLDATQGQIELLNNEQAAFLAMYPTFFMMNPARNPWACVGDCRIEPGLSRFLLGYTRQAFNLTGTREFGPMAITSYFSTASIGYHLGSTPPRPPSARLVALLSRILANDGRIRHNANHRTIWNVPGVIVGRPGPLPATSNLYYTFNTCGNGASHDHAAVGAYVVSVNGRNILGDPGGPEFYGAQFYVDRYNSAFTNATGHPVPVVSGFLQERGKEVCQRVPYPGIVGQSFTDTVDSVSIDMMLAYPQATMQTGLRRLVRTVMHDRRGRGRLTVMDTTTGNKLSRFARTSNVSGTFFIPGEVWRVNVTLVSLTHNVGNMRMVVEDIVDVDTKETWPIISTTLTNVQSAVVGFMFEPIL